MSSSDSTQAFISGEIGAEPVIAKMNRPPKRYWRCSASTSASTAARSAPSADPAVDLALELCEHHVPDSRHEAQLGGPHQREVFEQRRKVAFGGEVRGAAVAERAVEDAAAHHVAHRHEVEGDRRGASRRTSCCWTGATSWRHCSAGTSRLSACRCCRRCRSAAPAGLGIVGRGDRPAAGSVLPRSSTSARVSTSPRCRPAARGRLRRPRAGRRPRGGSRTPQLARARVRSASVRRRRAAGSRSRRSRVGSVSATIGRSWATAALVCSGTDTAPRQRHIDVV